MLGGQDDAVVAIAAEIEVGIAPGVELRRSAQGLAGASGSGALSGVVDECHGCGVLTLEVAQKGEQGCDIAADILVDAMQAHERIEDQELRLERGDGFVETRAVGLEIEAQVGCGDDLDVEFGEAGAGGSADALESAADDMERVLGGIEQDPAVTRDGEAAQARGSGGDSDGQVECEEGFAALWFAADDADGLLRPESVDEPAPLLGRIGETPGRLDRKLGHRRRRMAALAWLTSGAAQVSKNSASSICRASRWAAASSRSAAMIIRARGLPCA